MQIPHLPKATHNSTSTVVFIIFYMQKTYPEPIWKVETHFINVYLHGKIKYAAFACYKGVSCFYKYENLKLGVKLAF